MLWRLGLACWTLVEALDAIEVEPNNATGGGFFFLKNRSGADFLFITWFAYISRTNEIWLILYVSELCDSVTSVTALLVLSVFSELPYKGT